MIFSVLRADIPRPALNAAGPVPARHRRASPLGIRTGASDIPAELSTISPLLRISFTAAIHRWALLTADAIVDGGGDGDECEGRAGPGGRAGGGQLSGGLRVPDPRPELALRRRGDRHRRGRAAHAGRLRGEDALGDAVRHPARRGRPGKTRPAAPSRGPGAPA